MSRQAKRARKLKLKRQAAAARKGRTIAIYFPWNQPGYYEGYSSRQAYIDARITHAKRFGLSAGVKR